MIYTTINSLDCSKCGQIMWTAHTTDTDGDDLTGPDPEAFKCAYCGHVFPVPGWEPAMGNPDLSHPWATHKTPNEAVGIKPPRQKRGIRRRR